MEREKLEGISRISSLIISYFYGNSKRSIRERVRAFGLRGAFLKEHVARSGDGDYRTKV